MKRLYIKETIFKFRIFQVLRIRRCNLIKVVLSKIRNFCNTERWQGIMVAFQDNKSPSLHFPFIYFYMQAADKMSLDFSSISDKQRNCSVAAYLSPRVSSCLVSISRRTETFFQVALHEILQSSIELRVLSRTKFAL